MSDPGVSDPREPRPILLVEDDLDQAHLIRFLLEDGGAYQVTLAQDGVRGSRLARERKWALVVTDLNLPGALGFEVLDASREAHPGTPVLATTGHTESEYLANARAKGAAAVLLKPLDRDELMEQVQRLAVEGAQVTEHPPAQPEEPPTERLSFRPEEAAGVATPLHVLAVALRPGEIDGGCGGTMLRHLVRGDAVALLVLGEGDPGSAERARAAGRRMGARFFVGKADGSDETSFAPAARELLERAIRDVRPDVLYLPTPHRRDPLGAVVHRLLLELSDDVPRIFAYDPGDPTPDFRPEHFVAIDGVMAHKKELAELFDASEGSNLHPSEVAATARFWGRFVDAGAAEALEVLRGGSPWEGAGGSGVVRARSGGSEAD